MPSFSIYLLSSAILTALLHRLPLLTVQLHFLPGFVRQQLRTHLASASISSTTIPQSGVPSHAVENIYQHHAADDCRLRPAPVWPRKMIIVQRCIPDAEGSKADLATTVTYYDSDVGGNLIIITPDNRIKPTLWDLELDSHHSYYYTTTPEGNGTCKAVEMPVGILRRDWLVGAQPLGKVVLENNRVVCGWTKADFIDYYTDIITNEPAQWYFHTMKATFTVLSYQENQPINPVLFRPPSYCFAPREGK